MTGISSHVPKLAPDTIRRERIAGWLSDHADYPVRLLIAPSGSGKTTALVTYAAAPLHSAAYVSLARGTGAGALCAAIAAALGFDPTTDPAVLLHRLTNAGRRELLVDEVDHATPEARDVLRQLVTEAPENVTFAFAARSRQVIDATRLIATGLAVLLTADRLAFTIDEAARFVEAARANVADEREIARLVNDTEGWPFALCSAVRDAVSAGRALENAVDGWRRTNARFIASFVDENLAGEDDALAAAARRLFDDGSADESTLDELEKRGLFVHWSEGALRPYRALARLPRGGASTPQPSELPAFSVSLFGPADARIEGRRIEWIRRRDAQLFAFIAMQPNGRASRRTIVEAFWPHADHQLASASLRSACSTLRRALAAVVGYGMLAHYVTCGSEIALNLDLFAVDARRVRSHVADGDAAWLRGDVDVARKHAEAAARLAKEPFLNDDVPPALQEQAALLRAGIERARQYAGLVCPPADRVAV